MTAALVIAFFVTVPIVLAMTAGYRWNPIRQRVERTGIIETESKPDGANVTVGGKKVGVTPLSIRRLLPDDYEVRMEKDGYLPWSRKMRVDSARTSFTGEVVMLLDAAPAKDTDGNYNHGSWSPDGLKLAAVNDNSGSLTIAVWNRVTRETLTLADAEATEAEILWSPNSEKIAVVEDKDGESKVTLYFLDGIRQPIDLSASLPADEYHLHWVSNSLQVILVGTSSAYRLTLDGTSEILVTDESLVDVIARDRSMVSLLRDKNDDIILETEGITGAAKETMPIIPDGYARLSFWQGSTVTIANDRAANSISIDVISGDIRELRGTSFRDNGNGSRSIAWNNYEAFFTDQATGKTTLLTRLGEGIIDCTWIAEDTAIACLTPSKIIAIEADESDQRNVWTLADGENLGNLSIDASVNRLIFTGRINGESGIFYRPL